MPKIAIIGAGISGLGAASLFHPSHDITVFEKSDHIGGHARTKTIIYDGQPMVVDTGFIVFNHRNYPHLTAMFRHLNVQTIKSNMTFGVSANNSDLEWGAESLNALFGQRRNLFRPKFWRLLLDILHFNARAAKVTGKNPGLSLGQLLEKMKMGEWFQHYYLLPMGGAIWSCPLETMLAFPADEFIRFFEAHGLLTITDQPKWHTVHGGSQAYVEKLIAPFKDKIRLGQKELRISRINNQIEIMANGEKKYFDHVIFACAGDQILSMLLDASTEETQILNGLKTQKNIAYLHNDTSLMPKRKACWSAWVYHTEDHASKNMLSVTYWMNILQSIDKAKPIFVTLNPLKPIAPEKIFEAHEFHHPIYTKETITAQKQIQMIQGQRNTWFCGAWLKDGFHEDGLSSAVDVAAHFGMKPSWV